jgi:hypothetical protein
MARSTTDTSFKVSVQQSMATIARPRLDLSGTLGRNWPRVLGYWYGIIGPAEVKGQGEGLRGLVPNLNVIALSDPTRVESMIKNLEQALNITSGPVLSLDTGLPWSNTLPPVFFYGHVDNWQRASQVPGMRGVARLTTDTPPQIRYTIILRKNGQDVVRFEGVQIGGAGSRRGVVGVSGTV